MNQKPPSFKARFSRIFVRTWKVLTSNGEMSYTISRISYFGSMWVPSWIAVVRSRVRKHSTLWYGFRKRLLMKLIKEVSAEEQMSVILASHWYKERHLLEYAKFRFQARDPNSLLLLSRESERTTCGDTNRYWGTRQSELDTWCSQDLSRKATFAVLETWGLQGGL